MTQAEAQAQTQAQGGRIVVFVHGLWMSGHESILLRRELRESLDARIEVFTYRSVANDMEENARGLSEFLAGLRASRLDLIGHSLGGLVILKCLEDYPLDIPGRVVLLGTPLQGSVAARSLEKIPILGNMLGRGITQESDRQTPRRWGGGREVGVIAGNLPVALGQLFAPLRGAHDGTVTVEETHLPGAADHIVLPVSHTGMMVSSKVAHQCAFFLNHGRFDHEA